MKPLDPNIYFCRKCTCSKESASTFENLTENSENLTEKPDGNLTNDSVEGSIADLINGQSRTNSTILNSIGMEFVLVPAGEFDMGSPSREKRRKLWESPVHKVIIKKPFFLSRHPVTQEQWSKIMGNSPSYFRGEKYPVENVSWEEVQAFIRKLNAVENTVENAVENTVENAVENTDEKSSVYRLPTEAEWEYAARAGTRSSYFFGDCESKLTEYAWFLENSGFETHPVGLKKPNPWGFYDIYGNVGEWVQDEYHISYKGSPSDGRAWESPFSGISVPVRVRRGGGWNGNAGCCRSAERLFAAQDRRLNSLGFRVVKEV